MTLSQIKALGHIAWANVKGVAGLAYAAAKMLDDAIPYLGSVTITETYARSGHSSQSYHYKGLAIDFAPRSMPLWHAYLVLKKLGIKGIGIDPGQGILHIDTRTSAYYFLEKNGDDAGPLDSAANAAAVKKIPGFGSTPTVLAKIGGSNETVVASKPASIATTPAATKQRDTIVAALLPIVLIAAGMRA